MDSSTNWFLALKIWALAVLKFFDVVLKFELPNAWVLNFPQNSAPSLIGLVLIIGDYVYCEPINNLPLICNVLFSWFPIVYSKWIWTWFFRPKVPKQFDQNKNCKNYLGQHKNWQCHSVFKLRQKLEDWFLTCAEPPMFTFYFALIRCMCIRLAVLKRQKNRQQVIVA